MLNKYCTIHLQNFNEVTGFIDKKQRTEIRAQEEYGQIKKRMRHELEEFRKKLEEFKKSKNAYESIQIGIDNAEYTVKDVEDQNEKNIANGKENRVKRIWQKPMDIKCEQNMSNIHIIGIPTLYSGMEIKYVEIIFYILCIKDYLNLQIIETNCVPGKTDRKWTTLRNKIPGLQR